MTDAILYGFTRDCIEAKDFTDFLSNWWPSRLPEGPDLRGHLDRFAFWVDGYDDDTREMFVVPEVRAFYRAFNSRWPYWFFACSLAAPSLLGMTLCCLDSLRLTQRSLAEPWRADYKPSEMRAFLEQEIGRMEVLCRRAGMSPEETSYRRRRVLHYFLMHQSPAPFLPPAI